MKGIMVRAWQISKRAAVIFGGRPAEYITEALRLAWAEYKAEQYKGTKEARVEKLEKMGLKRWQKAGYDRLYVNAKAVGLTVEHYNTGNVCYAEWKGEKISNGRARRMMAAKVYIDVETMTVHGEDYMLVEAAREMLEAC